MFLYPNITQSSLEMKIINLNKVNGELSLQVENILERKNMERIMNDIDKKQN